MTAESAPVARLLFLACPLPPAMAEALDAWSAEHLAELPVKLVPAGRLHVTLMFFGNVSEETVATLARLTEQVEWASLHVRTGSLGMFGQRALATVLDAVPDDLERLEDRLGRTTIYLKEDQHPFDPSLFHRDDPLVQMSVHLATAEQTRKIRRQRQRYPLKLHATLARVDKRCQPDISALPAPEFVGELDRLVLFESILRPEGVGHRVVAEAQRSAY